MGIKFQTLCGLIILLTTCTATFADTKSGPITLQPSEFGPPDNATKIELGTTIKLVAQPYIINFIHSKVVTALATVTNTGKRPMSCVFHIAFFDKKNQLIGCVSQSLPDLKPGDSTQLGSCLVFLPPKELANIASYQAAFYESENQF